MKRISLILMFSIATFIGANAQNTNAVKVATKVKSEEHLSSSILLWMRTDKARQEGMNRWKGPHSKIISAIKAQWEYRQIHFAENNTGLWTSIKDVETTIPSERKIDGVADVTIKSIFSDKDKEQIGLAFKDEVNLFKRTILYSAAPQNSLWYEFAEPSPKIEARSMVFFRIKQGVKEEDFKKFFTEELTPMLANTGVLKELRSKVYNAWNQDEWNTPNVEHDNEKAVQFQASLILGFKDKKAMKQFFKRNDVKKMSDRLSVFCSAVHAYKVQETLTFVANGKELSLFSEKSVEPNKAYTHETVPTQYVDVKGIKYAYRSFGKKGGIPLLFFVHFTGTMDNWDPAITNPLSKNHHVILFDNKGVGSSEGITPTTIAEMATDAIDFITALGYEKVNILSFSLGGFVAQEIAEKYPHLVNKLILAGTGAIGSSGNTELLHHVEKAMKDGAENVVINLFFSETATSKQAGKDFMIRLQSRTENRDTPSNQSTFDNQAKAIIRFGGANNEGFRQAKAIKQPTLIVNGNNDIMVHTIGSYDLLQNMPNAKLVLWSNAGHGALFQYHEDFVKEVEIFLK